MSVTRFNISFYWDFSDSGIVKVGIDCCSVSRQLETTLGITLVPLVIDVNHHQGYNTE